MYTLFYSPGTASMVIHLALLEIGAPHVLKLVDIEQNQQKDPAYLKLNPNGVVPTLVVDDQVYIESAAILMMLSEKYPEAALAPAVNTADYHRWRQWIISLSHNLQATYRFWFYPQELGYTEHPEHVRQALQTRIGKIWDQLDAHLHAHGPYLLGDTFSSADLYLTMLMRWSRNMPRPATEWPALNRLIQLVVHRPSWKTMMQIEAVDAWPKDNQQ